MSLEDRKEEVCEQTSGRGGAGGLGLLTGHYLSISCVGSMGFHTHPLGSQAAGL